MKTKTDVVVIYVNTDNGPEGIQYFAEVVRNAGEENEEVLYASGFRKSPKQAIALAKRWLGRKGE